MSLGDHQPTGKADYSSVPFEDRISRRDYFQAAALTGILSATANERIKDDGYRRDAVMASSIMAGLVLEFGKAFEELREVASRVKDPAETSSAIPDTKSADLMLKTLVRDHPTRGREIANRLVRAGSGPNLIMVGSPRFLDLKANGCDRDTAIDDLRTIIAVAIDDALAGKR